MSSRKRAATQNAESSTSAKHAPKKTRFAEPQEDPSNFEEQVDATLEHSTRKGRVRNEGYDSDSTDDGEGVVESRKKNTDGENGMDDMFAVNSEDNTGEFNNTSKEEKYMRLADIEGQEFGNESHSDGDSGGDDEPEDEDDAERRKKAGMGYELSSFNMRDEMEEGKFTEDGSYVRTFDPNAVHDRWMEGLDEKEIKQARRRKREQERQQQERMLAEEKEIEESGGKAFLERELLTFLKKGETVLEALQRLGSKSKGSNVVRKPKLKAKEKETAEVNPSNKSIPTFIERITHLASSLMSSGDGDVYSRTYEELVRSVRSSGTVEKDWDPPSADIKYEYKWASPETGLADQTFGPFSEEELQTWFKASYFGLAGEKILVRRIGGDWGDWDTLFP